MIRKISFLLILLVLPGFVKLNAQINKKDGTQRQITLEKVTILTKKDSLFQVSLPVLKLPEEYKNRNLPVVVDNSELPYFRPIFNQVSMECGQASAVGYTFTYEIDRLRDLPANVIENQYPTHFVFNFSNSGSGSAASYFDSWTIIKEIGTPNVFDYGGTMSYGGVSRWMSGYDEYYRAMQNRIWDFYSIPLDTEEGLLTLRHWINDHLDGSETGGCGNIYCSYMSVSQTLPAGTPEAGMYVITSLGTYANHGLCVVGYHDSIRWDYNNDGQYTNNIDINNDGVVDLLDWEIGGVKLANSYYATSWGNNGFCYLMYNALCRYLSQGGVWNRSVHVVSAKEFTDPQLVYKITMTHTSRNKLKVIAGVNPDPYAVEPAYIIDFAVFNYQGGNRYMQGGTSTADKTIEFGLDVTPLLGFIDGNIEAKYFLLVDEDDVDNSGTGEINNWSVMDYTNGLIEIQCPQTNVPIVENGLTTMSVNATVDFDAPEITTEQLPPATINEPYECQMEGSGGTEPHQWNVKQKYTDYTTTSIFPQINEQQLYPSSSSSGFAVKEIDFYFPFYGKKYDKISVHTDGYLMFDEQHYPWTFLVDEFNLFKNMRNVAPYMCKPLGVSGGGMWYEGDASKATFRWKAVDYGSGDIYNFAVSIYPSGKIEFFYGELQAPFWINWHAGVSEGDAENFNLLDISNTYNIQPNTKIVIEPNYNLTELDITRQGLLYGTPTQPYEVVDIDFLIKDINGMRNMKTLPFYTDGINNIVIRDVSVVSGDDDIIEYGESVSVSIELQNISEEVIEAYSMNISINDEFIILTDSTENLATFDPGETIIFPDAFAFDVSMQVPNNHNILFETEIEAETENYNSQFQLTAYAPELAIGNITIDDGGNGYLEPGETADIYIDIDNNGGGTAFNIVAELVNNDPFITILQGVGNIEEIPGYNSGTVVFEISVDELTPIGYVTPFEILAEADYGYSAYDVFLITIGLIVEDFETGDFSSYEWGFGGNANWQIDSENPYEGNYCMKSGPIDHLETSNVFVTMDILFDSEISFYYKVSSEPSYDYLKFYIDGSLKGFWSGEQGWAQATYPVSAGEKTFKWTYEKDQSVQNGQDCGWVDFIIFPPSTEQTLVVSAGPDITICETESPQINGLVANAISLFWSTSGDGIFDDNTIVNPIYNLGTQDISNGLVDLTLKAYSIGGDSLTDMMTIFIEYLPIVWAGEDTLVCEDVADVPVNGFIVNTDLCVWSTSGDGAFDNPTSLSTIYHPGPEDIANGSVELTLTGFPVEPCVQNITDELSLEIAPLPEVTFAPIENFCHNSPPYLLTEGSPAGGVYSGTGVENGWFYPEVAGVGTHILTYTYTDNNGCENFAQQEVVVDDCTMMDNLTQNSFSIYPNPNNGKFEIILQRAIKSTPEICIYNSFGVMVYSEANVSVTPDKHVSIDLSTLPEGIYFINFKTIDLNFSRKLIIKK